MQRALALIALLSSSLVVQRELQDPVREDEGPGYPYRILPVDIISGHLMEGEFREPGGVFFDPTERELYVSDMKNGLIGIFNDSGIPLYAFGGGEQLVEPTVVVARPNGTIYVLDNDRTEIKAFDYRGGPLDPIRFVEEGGEPLRIEAFVIDADGRWIVADSASQRVFVFDAERKREFVLPREDDVGSFESIAGVAVSAEGRIAVIDRRATPVQVFDRRGYFVSGFGRRDIGMENFTSPRAVAFDEDEYIFVVDMLRHDVKIFNLQGEFQGLFGGWFGPETRGRAPGEMLYPTSISIEPGGRVFVAERFGNRVQAFERESRAPLFIDSVKSE